MAEPRARTEEEKMLAGDLYNSLDPELMAGRTHASAYCEEFNSLGAKVADDVKKGVLKELFGAFGSDTTILAPLRVDYGKYTYIGDRVFMNFGTTILDTCEVRIGNDVLFGPNCSLFTATHPLDPAVRRNWGPELGKPITVSPVPN
ncbi:trimeric LpxA-like protein [Phlyctochytrium arcticum]|nr:trimeric LpxA-like protein [Phlyctochytrium arcticum]